MPRRDRRAGAGRRRLSPGRGITRRSPGGTARVQDTICAPVGRARRRAPRTQRWSDAPALPVAHPRDGLRARRRRSPRSCCVPVRGPAAADPERPARRYVGRARQPRARRAAEAGGRGADGPAGAAGRGRRRPGRPEPRPSRPSPTRRRSSTTPRASWPATRRWSPGYASALYRDGGALTPLTLLLSGGDPGDVLSAMGFLDVVDAHAAAGDRRGRDAAAGRPWTQQRRAEAALEQAQERGGRGGRAGRRARGEGGRGHRRARRRARRRRQAAGAAAEGAGRRQQADGGQLAGLRRPADRGRGHAAAGGAAAGPAGGTAGRAGAGRRGGRGSAARAPRSCRGSPRRCWCCRPRRWPR